MPKYKELRIIMDVQARQIAENAGIDPTMYSKFENYRCLPIPSEFKRICNALNCTPQEIYNAEEVTLISNFGADSVVSRKDERPSGYKMTVRLSNDNREILTKEILSECGYKNIGDWVTACIQELKARYSVILETKNLALRLATNESKATMEGLLNSNPQPK